MRKKVLAKVKRTDLHPVWMFDGSEPLIALGDALVPQRGERRLRYPEVGAPTVRTVYEIRDGRPECVEISIKSAYNGRGIQTSDIDDINLESDVIEAFTMMGAPHDAAHGSGIHDPDMRPVVKSVTDARQRHRRPVSRAELQEVARIYRDHIAGSPTKAVADQMYDGIYGTAARRVQMARRPEYGFLPPTTPGKVQA